MQSRKIREAVCSSALLWPVKTVVQLFTGIVSPSTVYKWVNQQNTLNHSYTMEECYSEWKRIKSYSGSYDARPSHNRITTTFLPHFYHIEQELYKDIGIRKKLIENRKKYLLKDTFTSRELLRGFKISGIHTGYSHFSPLWIKRFITDLQVKTVYDPCGGWGHRLVGAASSGCNYIYNDIWKLSYNGIKKIVKFLDIQVTTYNNDCTKFIPQEDYDCVFTCPPYYNVEIYETPFKSLEIYNNFIHLMLKNACKPCVNYIGVVINSTYKHIIQNNIPVDFVLYADETLGSTSAISHFNAKQSTKREMLLIFKRIIRKKDTKD